MCEGGVSQRLEQEIGPGEAGESQPRKQTDVQDKENGERYVVGRHETPAAAQEKVAGTEAIRPASGEGNIQAEAAQYEEEADTGGTGTKQHLEREEMKTCVAKGIHVEQHDPQGRDRAQAVDAGQPVARRGRNPQPRQS